MTRRLFVCHANADIEATSELVDALENALNFSEGSLSTSGLPGYSADATDMPALGATLASSDVVLALVTTNSVRDPHVHFQLGAAWALGAHTVLFVLDPTAHAELPYALSHAPCVQASEAAEWSVLIGDLSVRLGLVPRPGASVAPALSPSFVLPPPEPPEVAPVANTNKVAQVTEATKLAPKIPPLPAALDDAAPELDVTAVARAMATGRAALPKPERARTATPQHMFRAPDPEPIPAQPLQPAAELDAEAETTAILDAAATLDAAAAAALEAVAQLNHEVTTQTEPARITVTALDADTVLAAVAEPDLDLDPDAEALILSDSILPEPEPEPEPQTEPNQKHRPPPLPAAEAIDYTDEEPHPADRRPPRHSYIDELRAIDLADEQAAATYALEQLEEAETGEQPRIPARTTKQMPMGGTPEPAVEQSAADLASDSDVFARLPTCEMALEAGRAVSDCVFNRDEIDDFASELNAPLGQLVECLGASWDELRSEQDLDTWVAVTDHLLQTLPNEVRKVEEWYRVGFELAILHNLAGQLVLDGSDAAAEQHWRGALERFLMRAERAGIGYENLGTVLGLLENLVGPSNERDLSNIPRSLEELRRYAAGADIHTAA